MNACLVDVTNGTLVLNDTQNSRATPFDMARSFMQVASISYATQGLLLGIVATAYQRWDNRTVGKPSFLDIHVNKSQGGSKNLIEYPGSNFLSRWVLLNQPPT